MMRRLAALALLAPVAWGCSSGLPRQRPADLMIRMTQGGGQPAVGSPLMEELVVSAKGGSHYKVEYQGGGATSLDLDPTDGDLDGLYEVLRMNHFLRITMREKKVYDRGGTDVTVEWEGHSHTVHDSGVSFVDNPWKDEWERIVEALKLYQLKKIDKPKQLEPPDLEETKYE